MRYQKIYVQIWNDEKFIELSEPSKIFFLYLLTSPHSNLIGAFVIKKGYIAEDLKWSIARVDKAIKELVRDELILFDVKVSVVAVSNYLKYNPLENPNQFTGAVKIYKSLPRTSILSSVFNMLVTLSKRFNRPFEGASKPEAVTVTGAATEEEPETPAVIVEPMADFRIFYNSYPKKKSVGQAEKTWNKLSPTNDLLKTMLIAIEAAKTSEDWTKDNGKWVPHPSTWLNNKGWEDEISSKLSKPKPPELPKLN